MNCQHCGEPLLVIPCRDCDGTGGWWCNAPSHTFVWRDCPTCHDQRTEAVCTNLDCPSKVWYPLRRAQQRVMEDEKHRERLRGIRAAIESEAQS